MRTVKNGKPNKRAFLLLLKIIILEFKCFFKYGSSIDKIDK